MKHLWILCSLALLLISGSSLGGAAPQPMNAVDFVELPRLSSGQLSPDGRFLWYERSTPDWQANRLKRRYVLLDVRDGTTVDVPSPEGPGARYQSARWRPDSDAIVVVHKSKKDQAKQLYLFEPGRGEWRRLSDQAHDVSQPRWDVGGQGIYFLSELPAPEPRDARLLKSKWRVAEYEQRRPKGVWRYDIATGKSALVFGDEQTFIHSFGLSPTGKQLWLRSGPSGLLDESQFHDLSLLSLESLVTRRLTDNQYRESRPALSPDGRWLSFIAEVNERAEDYYEDNLFIQGLEDQQPQLLFPEQAIEVIDYAWRADSKGLFVLGNIGLRIELFFYELAAKTLRRLTQGDHALQDWSYLPDKQIHLVRRVSAENPGEYHLITDEQLFDGGPMPESITAEYASLALQFALPRQQAVQWRGRGRQALEGLLVLPAGKAAPPYPLVTITHGGPKSSSTFGSWNMSRHVPVLTGQGYAVFLPNHRGGMGYGDAFLRDMVGNYFRNAHHDVMDGIDHLVEQGIADPQSLIKMGWSAGGHMTNKLIVESNRFQAASSGAGASEWIAMYGESDTRRGRTAWFGGTPWQARAPLKQYLSQSPLFKAHRVTTPTVFYVGEKDVRVPPTQSILMYRALKAAQVPTELYIAEGEPHGFGKPRHRLFKINQDLEWFAHHVLDAPYVAIYPEAAEKTMQKKPQDDGNRSEEPVTTSTSR